MLTDNDLPTPLHLRVRLHLSDVWYVYVVAGMLAMPLAIEAGIPLAGTLGYLCALVGVLHAPRALWARLSPEPGPLRAGLILILGNMLLRSLFGR